MTSFAACILAFMLGSGLGTAPKTMGPPYHPVPCVSSTEAMEREYIDLVNRDRQAAGLQPLTPNPLLADVARGHSLEMAEKGYFDHISPSPGLRTPMQRYLRASSRMPVSGAVAENLYYCSIVDVERGHRAFMGSEPHKRNIVNPRYEEIGVGCYVGPGGELYVTEMFLYQRFGTTIASAALPSSDRGTVEAHPTP